MDITITERKETYSDPLGGKYYRIETFSPHKIEWRRHGQRGVIADGQEKKLEGIRYEMVTAPDKEEA